jgi:hypothetical protein
LIDPKRMRGSPTHLVIQRITVCTCGRRGINYAASANVNSSVVGSCVFDSSHIGASSTEVWSCDSMPPSTPEIASPVAPDRSRRRHSTALGEGQYKFVRDASDPPQVVHRNASTADNSDIVGRDAAFRSNLVNSHPGDQGRNPKSTRFPADRPTTFAKTL